MLEFAGIALLPEWPLFLSFVLAGLALNIVPGADMTFVIAAAARGGRRDGMVAALGIGAGTLFHILAAVLGLSAILASSQTAFDLIKWIGAAYLLWIAFSLLRSGGSADSGAGAPAVSGLRLLRAAMLVNILNPKVALFFLALLPQFIAADAAHKLLAFLFLGAWFVVQGALFLIAFVLLVALLGRWRAGTSLRRGLHVAGAGLFAWLAVRLALVERV